MSGYLVVRTGGLRFGLRLTDVLEVSGTDGVSPVPGSHPAVRGVVRIRERLVLLVHLAALLTGSAPPDDTSPTCVLTELAGRPMALELDEVVALVRDEPRPVPAGWQVPWASAVAGQAGDLIPVIDGAALVRRLAPVG